MPFEAGDLLLQVLIRQIRMEAHLRQVATVHCELAERLTGRDAREAYAAMREDAEAEAHAVAVGVLEGLGLSREVIRSLLGGGGSDDEGFGLNGEQEGP